MNIGDRYFDTSNHTYVMGILNVTPDSFSDGGSFNSIDKSLARVQQMISEGVDIIDIGGESTRPGYTRISDEEEIQRVAPVIEQIKREYDIPISLDTYKSQVARAGIEAGADLINDIWGLKADPDMARVIAEGNVSCCLMHNKDVVHYEDFLADVCAELQECVDLALAAGIDTDKIILDPGVGFGKSYEHNLLTIQNLSQFNALGYPVLLGSSRKSVIGLTLDLPTDQRLEGTIATSVVAVMSRMAFVRVHDIKENVRAIRMTEAIRDITI